MHGATIKIIKFEVSDGSFELGLVNFGSLMEYTSQYISRL